jgi:four helix bundle protein
MIVSHRRVTSYRDLTVWQQAMDLVDLAYELTKHFPKDERFGLTAQLQRCSVSIPSNIAEGHGRDHLGEYLHHLGIANGSLMELETQVLIAARRSYIAKDEAERVLALSRVVGRLLAGLVRALKLRIPRPPTPDTRHQTPDT